MKDEANSFSQNGRVAVNSVTIVAEHFEPLEDTSSDLDIIEINEEV